MNTRKKLKNTSRNNRKIKIVVFDMDGVLTDTYSSWKYVHDYFNTSNEKSVDEYLKGNIDDLEFISRDCSLWLKEDKFFSEDKLSSILSSIPLMKGAQNCISKLNGLGVKTGIVSAGLDILARDVQKKLGLDFVYANGLKADENGCYTSQGLCRVKLMYKDEVVNVISKRFNVDLSQIASVGNSCFDLPMLKACGLGVAFNPADDCICEGADFVFENKDLECVADFLSDYI